MIIGICGKARSGKNTFAEMLAEELFDLTKRRFVLMAYATELKSRCQRDFDLSWHQLWGDDKEATDLRYKKPVVVDESEQEFWTGREILQAYGQFFRTIHPNFWVDKLFEASDSKEYKDIIITDVRHPNEADPIKQRGGLVLKIVSNRPDIPQVHGTQHISEVAMDDYRADYTVVNDFTLDVLRGTAKEVASLIIEKGDK